MSARTTGCRLAPDCLTCPLPDCRFDDPYVVARTRARELTPQVLALAAQGRTYTQIAADLGIGRRTVVRYSAPVHA